MDVVQIIFLVAAAFTLVAALMVVTTRKLVHAALWLIVALAGVSVLFVLLSAPFLAVVQVVVYIGAIAILIIFSVMLTRNVMQDTTPQTNRRWWMAALIAVALFAALLILIVPDPALATTLPAASLPAEDALQQLGQSLVDVNRYVLPFELASVLLLAALIGALFVGRPSRADEEGGAE
jgi:NADH-quinone oxidoreductase subunit J